MLTIQAYRHATAMMREMPMALRVEDLVTFPYIATRVPGVEEASQPCRPISGGAMPTANRTPGLDRPTPTIATPSDPMVMAATPTSLDKRFLDILPMEIWFEIIGHLVDRGECAGVIHRSVIFASFLFYLPSKYFIF